MGKKPAPLPKDTPAAAATGEVPITPTKRPGTSGTELGLRANREKASNAFQRAAKAEQAYRAKRQAHAARQDLTEGKQHLREGWKHLKEGMACYGRAVKAVPSVLRERRNGVRDKKMVKRQEEAEKKRKKLEAEIEKSRAMRGDDGEDVTAAA